ncbi:Hsp70 family protein [Amycolatopsis thailandensis]|uniref:Molecular chaperone DnaK n=1 Tax=Amycolatopsis thailandensis TaxID=589330 RepID=A0A229SIN2_9PSEU|nr:molecular chaperone DnaK [Amycolatopsis thailandensis]OXM58644.1 molecular chaperone DnaK [Amycolatopsis thailandensis]
MPYVLGIDIASTRTTAATCVDSGDGWGAPEPSWLGARGPSAATAVFLDDDGYLLTGDAAVEAGLSAPARLLTGFHERVGDDVPVIVGGERFPAESLSAVLVDAAVDQAAERFGEKPRHIVLTHPVGWGSFRRDLLRRALAEAGFPRAALVPAPVAALHAYLAPRGEVTAGVCEFGPDGAVVTIAATGVNGWQPVKTVEGVDPGEAVGKVFELAHGAGIPPQALAGIVLCGEAPPVSGRTPCPVFASSDPVLTVATGAANIAARRDVPRPGGPRSNALAAVETVETTLLPRVDPLEELTERPERPPVDITPFPLPEPTGAAKLLSRRKPIVAGAAVVVLAATTLFFTLTTREATADKGPEAPPATSSSCAPSTPGATPTSPEGRC